MQGVYSGFCVPGSDPGTGRHLSLLLTSTGSHIFVLCLPRLPLTDMHIPSRCLSAAPEWVWSRDRNVIDTQWLETPQKLLHIPDVQCNLFQSDTNSPFCFCLLPRVAPLPGQAARGTWALGPALVRTHTCAGRSRCICARDPALLPEETLDVPPRQSSWVQPASWTLPCSAYV